MARLFIFSSLFLITFFTFTHSNSQPQSQVKNQKSHDIFPFSATNFLYNKCLVFTQSLMFSPKAPVCSIEDFVNLSSKNLLKMNTQQLQSIPPFYFESLHPNQAIALNPAFITKLSKEQVKAFPFSTIQSLTPSARKTLNKIKKQIGLVSRITIMILAALTAWILFKHS